jgi:hypothetical protein
MITLSFALRPDICTILALCKCAATQCAFNLKIEKTNEKCTCGRGVKIKKSKTNWYKTKAIYTQNVMMNVTLTGRYTVTFI